MTEQHDPIEVFDRLQKRRTLERQLEEHEFTLEEVQELRAAASGDVEATRDFKAMLPYIERSNQAGHFRYPWQMAVAEYAEYVGAGGKPVYTLDWSAPRFLHTTEVSFLLV